MFSSGLCTALLVAAAYLLMRAGFSGAQMSGGYDVRSSLTKRVTTCDGRRNIHLLVCDAGFITVETAFYGRANMETCMEYQIRHPLMRSPCSYTDALTVLSNRCNGKKVCETQMKDFRFPDPCFGTHKYLETKFTCSEEIHAVACENSYMHLQCDPWEVISVLSANYGRRDRTTCSNGRRAFEIKNNNCLMSASKVAESCNGSSSCNIKASNAVFGDPCLLTHKYLEVAYKCEYRILPPPPLPRFI